MTVVIDRNKRPEGSKAPPLSVAERTKAKGADTGSLYKPRTPIYPKKVDGRWRNVKWALLIATLAVYYATPWIRWPRPAGMPQQAVLVDFDHGRFYFFFIHLWPQEVYFITGLLVLAALALFLTSALFGRLWCGYACPQTVWTDLFLFAERMWEGDRNAHMRRDAGKLTFDTAWRKTAKHVTWLIIAFSTGGAWIFYFHDAPTLIRTFWVGEAQITAYASCAILTFTTYALAGTMREQVCEFMCPWPRIQGAMLDSHSLQVTYRADRGEPRGPHKKTESWGGRGDCIDCNQCVVVCPMGIDIRNGAQFACINCGLCADACDAVMAKVVRPKGLIAYDTDFAVAQRTCGKPATYHLVRPRTIFYAAALSGVGALMLWALISRPDTEVHVIRDRNPMFVQLHDGAVRDGYTLKISNRSFVPRTFHLSLQGLAGAVMKAAGDQPATPDLDLQVGPDQVRTVRLFVTAPQSALHASEQTLIFRMDGSRTPFSLASSFSTGLDQSQ
jgi:cytochrome c oxidase accessory protein FixG